jgi:quinol monooxygenase YgiN
MEKVVIYGAIGVKPEEVERITAIAAEFVAEVHQEEGCVAYELSWDVVDPTVLRLVEHWVSDEAYQVHRVQPHVAAWAKTIAAAQASPLSSTKFRATDY